MNSPFETELEADQRREVESILLVRDRLFAHPDFRELADRALAAQNAGVPIPELNDLVLHPIACQMGLD